MPNGRLDKILKFLSDPANRPSWLVSTLAQLACWSVFAFTVAASYVGRKLAAGAIDEKTAALIMAPFATLLSGFGMSYLTARKVNGGNPPTAGGAAGGG